MNQRKLIQHGTSSLTVALPIRWIKTRNLVKGNPVFVHEEGNKLIISTDETVKIGRISVDVTDLDRTSILLYVQSLYRFGYDEIEVHFNKPTIIHHRTKKETSVSSVIHQIINRCIGAEIIEQTKNKIIIKHLTKESEDDFKVVLRRIMLLLKDVIVSFNDGVKNNDKNILETIEEKHDTLNKFTNYCLRLLNKYGYPDVKQTSMYFHIIASIDKVVDPIKYAARDFLEYNKKPKKETIEILEQINKSIELYYTLFYTFNIKTVNDLSDNRDYVKTVIDKNSDKIPGKELIIVTKIQQIQELLLDLTEFRMGLEY